VARGAHALPVVLALYRQLPDEVRRCTRPLNLLDEVASFLPGALRAHIELATEMARRLGRLRRVRYPLRRLEGDGLSCLVAADDLWTRYWRRTLFREPPGETLLAEVSALRIPAVAGRLAPTADLSLWQASWPVGRLTRRGARIPGSVRLWLPTARGLEEVVAGDRVGRDSRKDDVRRVRRLGLSARVTRDADEWERFRRALYVPYTQRRFGDLFVPVPVHAFRHARRSGWLVLLQRGGRAVAGAALERWGAETRLLAFGVDEHAGIPAGLLLQACYYHAIRFAVERRLPRLSLGAVRPVLTDGVLRYKRKWGGRLSAPASWDAFLFRYRNTRAVRRALAAAPLVIERREGGLAAVAGANGDALDVQLDRLDVRGLEELGCLVDGAAPARPPVAPFTPVTVVAPDAVWPPEARAG
jgi:hypothetical protein